MVWSVFNYLLTQKLPRKAKVALVADRCSQYKKLLKTLKVAQKLPSTIYLCLLSRLPVDSTPDAAIKQTEEYARSIVADAIPAALSPHLVERESERDPTLQLVRHAITSGDWTKPQGTTYKAIRDQSQNR